MHKPYAPIVTTPELVEECDKFPTLMPGHKAGAMHCGIRILPKRMADVFDESASREQIAPLNDHLIAKGTLSVAEEDDRHSKKPLRLFTVPSAPPRTRWFS